MSDNGGKGMLKSFDELVKLDVRPYCDVRDTKDEKIGRASCRERV